MNESSRNLGYFFSGVEDNWSNGFLTVKNACGRKNQPYVWNNQSFSYCDRGLGVQKYFSEQKYIFFSTFNRSEVKWIYASFRVVILTEIKETMPKLRREESITWDGGCSWRPSGRIFSICNRRPTHLHRSWSGNRTSAPSAFFWLSPSSS